MNNTLKPFLGIYEKNTACNCHPEWDTRRVVISAITIEQALGFALEAYPDTKRVDWNIIEIPTIQLAIYDEDGDMIKSFEK